MARVEHCAHGAYLAHGMSSMSNLDIYRGSMAPSGAIVLNSLYGMSSSIPSAITIIL